MARQVICKICKNKLPKDEAYCLETRSKDGKIKRSYYCDSVEYENYMCEKELTKKQKEEIFNYINYILGYECISYNLITKELNTILDIYTYEEVIYCFKSNKDNIKEYMNLKNINSEYNKIRYIFTVIASTIADTTKAFIKEKEQNKIKKVKAEKMVKYEPKEEYVYSNDKTTDFSNFF